MSTRVRSFATLAFSLLSVATLFAGVEEIRGHVELLSSAELEGRLTGSEGEVIATDYVAGQLKRLGAKPLPGQADYRLPFEFTAGTSDAGSSVALRPAGDGDPVEWTGSGDVQALSFSENGTVTGPVVFAGYGLLLPEDEDFGYNSYFGLDVEDKIVVVLRYVPEDVDQEVRAKLTQYSGLRYKVLHARELGAKAVVLVTGPRSPNAGATIPMTFDTELSGSGIVAASLSSRVADRIFESVDKTLEQAQKSLDDGNPHVQGFDIPGLELTLDVKVKRERKTAINVVGMLPATEPAEGGAPADSNYVLLGAHLDHLGHGRHGNSLAKEEEAGEIHHGADDNASGVAALLEAAERLVDRPRPRPVLLAFWTGEEIGLLGSSRFLKSGLVPADRIHAYVNLDMVGRMRDNRLSLQSAGSSSVWPGLIERTNAVVGFDVGTHDDPYVPTDATTFYLAGVPSIHFFTGSHEDYHRPTDRAEQINYDDLERVAQFTALFASNLGRLPERPDYVKVARTRDDRVSRDAVRAFTGTIPDYTTEVEGLRLSGVVGDGPADRAGLAEGDVIVEFAGQKVNNIYDYTYALDSVKIDVPVTVVFMRDGERHEVTITPTSRK